jgi:hypothetical protein
VIPVGSAISAESSLWDGSYLSLPVILPILIAAATAPQATERLACPVETPLAR